MNRKKRKRSQSIGKEPELPEWLQDNPPAQKTQYCSKQWLDEVSAGTEKGIRDTHAWKELVRRVGLKKARAILKTRLLRWQDIPGNSGN